MKPILFTEESIRYLMSRLEDAIDLIDSGCGNMACAVLLADISALKSMLINPIEEE